MKFKSGGIVILKSNGPNMVMEAPASDGRIVCIWFDGNRLKREAFQLKTLRRLRKRRGFSTIALGVWIWGGFTTILAIGCLVVVFLQGFSVGFVKEMFESLKETGTLVAGILGFSGLAWAHFFAVNNRIPAEEGVPEPEPPERAESDDGRNAES
jgi:uncharacterized protein YodC (DUF2158 family)